MRQHPDVEVYILSSKILGEPPYCEAEKNAWLDKWLPEIDAAHRIFPAVGTSKADCVEGGVTKDDYLLDDYNKSLRQFEAAGGSAVKCHNNLNQRGAGAYGGDRGERWDGAMVHTEDRGEMVAAELAQRMGLEYDLAAVMQNYDLRFDPHGAPFYKGEPTSWWKTEQGLVRTQPTDWWSAGSDVFQNPLNAIRALQGNRGFEELPLDFSARGERMTKAQLIDAAFNLGIDGRHFPLYESPSADWETLAYDVQYALREKTDAPQKDPDAIQRAAEDACAQQEQQVSAGLEADAADITE